MESTETQIKTPVGAGQKLLHFPLTKIIIGIIVVVGVVTAGQFAIDKLFSFIAPGKTAGRLTGGILTAILALASYGLLFKFYEKRNVTELGATNLGKNLGLGFLLGACLQSLTILVIYIMGGFTILSVNPISFLLPAFIMAFTSAIFEEILVRGIIFRLLEEKLGSYIALLISALIFGALHLANPNSSFIAALGLALQAGVFLAAAYIYTRNLWFPIAIHFAWNFTQSGIYGAAVSGNSTHKSLLSTTIQGAEWYTGGGFGPEGSIQATVFCFSAAVVLLIVSKKQNKIVLPFWKSGILKK